MQPPMEATLTALYGHRGMDTSRLPHNSGSGRYERKKFCCVLPRHADRTPSATVRYEPGWYSCYGCDASTNAIGLIMEVIGCDVAGAYRWARENIAGYSGESRQRESPEPYRPSWVDG